jgi:hypothetical protein
MIIERRMMLGTVEYRETDDGPALEGLAAPFGKLSEDLGWGLREKIDPGAFADVLDHDVRALFNHNPDNLLGRTKEAGTLTLWEDERGLRYRAMLPDTQLARDVVVNVRAKNITGNSFAFVVDVDEFARPQKKNDPTIRTVKHVAQLFDVGPVTYPAYSQTKVSTRSLEIAKGFAEGPEEEDFEAWLSRMDDLDRLIRHGAVDL